MTLSELGVCVSATDNSKGSPSAPPPLQTQELYDVKGGSHVPPMERCTSNTSTFSFSQDICRICHCEGDAESPLIAPCYCAGSLRYVHQSCLQQWIKSSDTKCCELCRFNFIMHSKIKPFNKWEKLDMSGMERRKIFCSVAFHVVALTCVVWSLYVLIERTTEEVQEGSLEWPFWTKLIVVAIGFTGGLVFMYVQCKMYVQLCKRWRAFNRVIYVQNAPEKVPLSERDRSELQRESTQLCGGGGGGGSGGGVKDNCGESHDSDKSLMGVLSGIRRPRANPQQQAQQQQLLQQQVSSFANKSHHHHHHLPERRASAATREGRQTFETPFTFEGGRCNHGSMEELSSHNLAQNDLQQQHQQKVFRKSSAHSICLDTNAERSMVGAGVMSHQESENIANRRGSRAMSNLHRGDVSRAEPRMIHTPSLSLQCRTDSGVETHEVETLHLDKM